MPSPSEPACSPEDLSKALATSGWVLFPNDPAIRQWVAAALPAARQCAADPAYRQWWRHDKTWFVGVNALENDTKGAVPGGPPLGGQVTRYINQISGLGGLALDRGQVSVCRPGYPGRDDDESEANHRYRKQRDAAHIDGLLRRGPDKRRYLGEFHAYILGIPMTTCDRGASPFVIWEGSHLLARETFLRIFEGMPVDQWPSIDLTDTYHTLRRNIFEQCPRRLIHTEPGQVYLVHRMTLHGMAPWEPGAQAGPDGRMICYFRPPFAEPAPWLDLP